MSRALSMLAVMLALPGCTLGLATSRHQSGAAPVTDAGPRPDGSGPDDGGSAPDGEVSPDAPPPNDAGLDAAPDTGEACDLDHDGYRAESCGGDDCDDTRASVHPFATPICGNNRAESCSLGEQAALLELLGAQEVGLIPATEVAHDTEIPQDLALSAALSTAAPLGHAVVAFRARRSDGYVLGARDLDLTTGAILELPWIGEGLVARAVGSGHAGAPDPYAAIVIGALTSPDEELLRGVQAEMLPDGSGGANAVVFTPMARLAVGAIGGWGDTPWRSVFAGDDRLISYGSSVSTVVETMLPEPFAGGARVRADATSGSFVLFASPGTGQEVIWDATPIACVADVQCPNGTPCGADGVCTVGRTPMKPDLPEHFPGDLAITWDGAQLVFAHPINAEPGVVHVGVLACDPSQCGASSNSTLVVGGTAGWVQLLEVEALSPTTRVIVASVATEGIRLAFHDAGTDRQIAPIAGEIAWTLTPPENVEALATTSTIHHDPIVGTITTVLVAYQIEGGTEDRIAITGMRACEQL